MECPYCGAENTPGSRFCWKCGQPVKPDDIGADLAGRERPKNDNAKSLLLILCIVLALMVTAGIVAAIVFLGPGTAVDAADATPETEEAQETEETLPTPSSSEQAAGQTGAPSQTAPPPAPTMQADEDTVFANFDTYILTYEDLKRLESESRQIGGIKATALELALNEIRATHGYPFTQKKWKTYFSEKSWYKASGGYDELQLSLTARINCLLIQMWQNRENKESKQWVKPAKVRSGDAIDLDGDGKTETIAFGGDEVTIGGIPVAQGPGIKLKPFSKDKSTPFDYIYLGDIDIDSSNGLELFIPANNSNEDLHYTNEAYRFAAGSIRYLGSVNRTAGTSLSINGMGKAKGKALYGKNPMQICYDEVFSFDGEGFVRKTKNPENTPLFIIPKDKLICFDRFSSDISQCANDEFSEEDVFDSGQYFKFYKKYGQVYRYVGTDETGKKTYTDWNLVVYNQGGVYYVLQAYWVYYYDGSDPVFVDNESIPLKKAISNLWIP